MQTCSICEKPIYGHPEASNRPVVCGSCTLTASKSGGGSSKPNRTMSQVRLDMGKLVTQPSSLKKDFVMADAVVRSNYARNRTILLDGRHALFFNAQGVAVCPSRLCEALEREMDARPGRYWYEASVATVIPSVSATPVVEVAPEIPQVEMPRPKKEETPVQIDLSFLEGEPKKALIQGKGKQKKLMEDSNG